MNEGLSGKLRGEIKRIKELEFRDKVILAVWLAAIGCIIFSIVRQPGILFLIIFIPAGILAVFASFIFLSTKVIEWSVPIRYVTSSEYPDIHEIVSRLSAKAGIPKPKVGICKMEIPNAFTFGGFQRSARICVSTKLMETLQKDELEAVLGHEIAHIKHRDVAIISALSLPPLLCYYSGRALFFFSLAMIESEETREESGGLAFRLAMIPIALGIWFTTLAIYTVGQLVELYVSRQREYSADRTSAELTENPRKLASALFKITHASALLETEEVRQAGAIRVFLASDPSTAKEDLKGLKEAGLDEDGVITDEELEGLIKETRRTSFDKAAELFSTHPNPADRIRRLISLEKTKLQRKLEISRKAVTGWWLLPVFLWWLGGLIAWSMFKKENPEPARNMLTLGIILTAVICLVFIL